MGRKRKEKLARRQGSAQAPARTAASGEFGWSWIVGAVLVVALAIGGGIYWMQANRGKLLKAALQASTAVAQAKLTKTQARFAPEAAIQIAQIIAEIDQLAADPRLDARAAGQLQFVLNVLDEVFREGNLQPEELAKMENLTQQVRFHLRQGAARSDSRP